MLPNRLIVSERGVKAAFLFTHYQDYEAAKTHLAAITHDPSKFLYEVSKEDDKDKLYVAASQPTGYNIYINLFEKPWKPGKLFAMKIKKYINWRLNWKPKKSDDIQANISVKFGELFITLKFNGIHEAIVKVEDIDQL